jgi:FKBP12-rapamycin complex-associated protein
MNCISTLYAVQISFTKNILALLQVLGIMGALDPHVYKRNQARLPGSHGDVTHAASDSGHVQSMDDLPMDLWPSFATSEDYYSTVVHQPDI